MCIYLNRYKLELFIEKLKKKNTHFNKKYSFLLLTQIKQWKLVYLGEGLLHVSRELTPPKVKKISMPVQHALWYMIYW